jgi:6-hydroxycyclohex-1-ene-1-carbonyl-CoA dehydrogenase
VVGIDVDAEKLETMKRYGVDLAVDAKAGEQAAVEAIKKFAAERGIRSTGWRIYECSGSKAGQALAWRLLGHAGWLSVVGFTLEKLELRLSNLMAFDAIAAGNWGCLPELYPEILELVLDGRVQVSPFVKKFPMDQVWSVLNGVHEKQIRQRLVLVP